MLRIFVTGDNHIGLKYSGHEQAAVLAQARIDAFAGMVRAANDEGCGLFVITGDLFDKSTGILQKEIKQLLAILDGFEGTVAVLPGNHDYYDESSPAQVWRYFRDEMAAHHNVMLLSAFRPYDLTVNGEAVRLYPAFCETKHSVPNQNHLGWMKDVEMESGVYHIGVAHGSVEGESLDDKGEYFPMKRAELAAIPVDAWLIGHTHVPFPRHLTTEYAAVNDNVFNAGTHVQTDVSCNTEGLCFVVEIGENKTVRAKKVVTGNLRFYRKEIAVTAGEFESILSRELADLADNSVVDLILSGAVTIEEYDRRHEILQAAMSRFVEGTYHCYDLSKRITADVVAAEFAETSFSAGLLTALLDEPKEAQMVYELLKALKEGK